MGRRLALTILVAVCVTGCGGSKSPSPSAYRDRVLAVCGRHRPAMRAEERRQERTALASPRNVISATPTARLLRSMLADVRKIRPPTSEQRLVARWLRAGEKVAAMLIREDRVLLRDKRLLEKELKHLKLPPHKLSAEEIKHPTAAIIDDVAAHSPAWRKFMRDGATVARQSLGVTREFEQLASKLGVGACAR